MKYCVSLTEKASGELASLPKHIQKRITRRLTLLGANPRQAGTKKLQGPSGLRRAHAGPAYVIVYHVKDDELLVLVVRVAHRKEAYDGL